MSFGLEWRNNSSALVVSAERYGMVFIGNATFTGTEKPEAYKRIGQSGTGYTAVVGDKFYIYQISSATAPIAFIQLLGNYFSISSIEYVSGTTWNIVVASSNWATVPVVKCFAKLQGAGGAGYGIRTYDASGARMWDSTENMLVMARRDIWTAASDNTSSVMQQTISLTGISNPYIMSTDQCNLAAVRASGSPVGGLYTMSDYIAGWAWIGSNTLSRGTTACKVAEWKDDSRIFYNTLLATRSYIISGDLY